MRTVNLFGCPCSAPASPAEIEACMLFLARGPGGYTVAINAEKIMMHVRGQGPVREVIGGAALAYPDGAGAVLGIRRLHRLATFKVDMPRLTLELCHEHRLALFLLGASEPNNRLASEQVRLRYPGIRLAGRRNGFFQDSGEVGNLGGDLARLQPDVILVGMGSPRQEILSRKLATELGKGLFVCCGGAIDILSGTRARAPAFMVNHGLEWAYRIASDPRRASRALPLVQFMFKLLFAPGGDG